MLRTLNAQPTLWSAILPQRFDLLAAVCRIPWTVSILDPPTLMKITTRCGSSEVLMNR